MFSLRKLRLRRQHRIRWCGCGLDNYISVDVDAACITSSWRGSTLPLGRHAVAVNLMCTGVVRSCPLRDHEGQRDRLPHGHHTCQRCAAVATKVWRPVGGCTAGVEQQRLCEGIVGNTPRCRRCTDRCLFKYLLNRGRACHR